MLAYDGGSRQKTRALLRKTASRRHIPSLLICIAEALVLLIRHRCPYLGRQIGILGLLLGDSAAPVLKDVIAEQEHCRDDTASQRAHDRQLGRAVVRSVAGLERLGADDVTQ